MKESTARIGDTHDRTVSECFPCRWSEIKKCVLADGKKADKKKSKKKEENI